MVVMRVRWRSKNLMNLALIAVVAILALSWIMSLSTKRRKTQAWQKHQPHLHEFGDKDNDGNYIVKRHEIPLQPPDDFVPGVAGGGWKDNVMPLIPKQIRGVFGAVGNAGTTTTTTASNRGPTPVLKDGVLGNFEKPETSSGGPGEEGKPVYLSMEEKSKGEKSVAEFGFNMVVSEKISMDRTVPDIRMPECKYWHYPTDLPTASVVVVFHNEGFGVVLRTVHSVIKRSPPQFLHEVVLIDDRSDYDALGKHLDEYIKRWNGKVKVYRNENREGLIRARTIGAQKSKGDVVVFLDAHCEVNHNWLVPLLAVIRENRKVMAVPIVDGIDAGTFEYRSVYQRDHYAGIFEWGFLYKESKVPDKELKKRKYNSEPYNSPTHAGGLFAIDRLWFEELGYYDSGLEIWGGEQYELSFKIWQCGGGLKWVPCSRVGHIYRLAVPRNRGAGKYPKVPLLLMNHIRVIETWFDDKYKEYFYRREPLSRDVKVSDISAQLAIKEKLQCKNFTWFMENVAYDLEQHYPHPPENAYWGELKQEGAEHNCWTEANEMNTAIHLSYCNGMGYSQLFRLNSRGQLGIGERCIEADFSSNVRKVFCPTQPEGDWAYDPVSKLLKNKKYDMCAESSANTIVLRTCNPSSTAQRWIFREFHPYRE